MIGSITLEGLYFQLQEDSLKAPEVIVFLEDHQHLIEDKFPVIWDGLPAHRSKLVADYPASKECRVSVKRLQSYAPELNPIEYLWRYAKRYNLAKFAPKKL